MKKRLVLALTVLLAGQTLLASGMADNRSNDIGKAVEKEILQYNRLHFDKVDGRVLSEIKTLLEKKAPSARLTNLGPVYKQVAEHASLANEEYVAYYVQAVEPARSDKEKDTVSYYLVSLYRRTSWDGFTCSDVEWLNSRPAGWQTEADKEIRHIAFLRGRLEALNLPENALALFVRKMPLSEIEEIYSPVLREDSASRSLPVILGKIGGGQKSFRMEFQPAGRVIDDELTWRCATVK